MKWVFILFLIVLLSSLFVTINYSECFIPSFHFENEKNLIITTQLDNFDRYDFSLDEHIEEAEFIVDDEITRKSILHDRLLT